VAPDLIPPPSPAGKPPPDSGVDERAADAALAEAAQPRVREQPAGPSPYRGRFGFVWGALAGVAVCVLALGVFLAVDTRDSGPKLAEHWSSWKPSTSRMLAGAEDIAAHIGREYKQDSGDQLATISSSGMSFAGGPLDVAVRPKGGELQVLSGADNGVLYVLAGLAADSSAITGRARKTNERLMMREAVELALYSFRYLDDITMVGIMLPPRKGAEASSDGQQATRMLFFRPGDLLDKLEVPLSRTLSAEPPRPKALTEKDALQIDSLALRNLFLATIQQLTSQQYYLVLAPPEVID
jgi:hypothetical protein